VIRGRWAWVPGARVARPIYAPALVAWVGDPGWNVSFAFGAAPAVGWFPLAPREVYVPGYRYSATYIRQINVTHVTSVREIERATGPGYRPAYAHRERGDAVTVVPAAHLRDGRPVDRAAIARPQPGELGRAPVAARSPGFDFRPAGSGRVDNSRRDEREGRAPSPGASNGNRPEQALPRGREPVDRPIDRGSDDRGRYDPARRSDPQMPDPRREQRNDRPLPPVSESVAPPSREVPRADRMPPESRQETFRQPAPRPEPQRMEAPRPQPRLDPPRVEQPRMEAPRPSPQIEPPRMDPPRPPQPRFEAPRVETPRPPPRLEPPRTETPRPPQPRLEAPRMEPPPRQPGDGGQGRGGGGRQDQR
jgi:hypothetical protein